MSEAIEALREAYFDAKERAEAFEAMSICDFIVYRAMEFIYGITRG